MKLSDGVEASVHCATLLAQLDEGRTMPASALAEYHGLSQSYLLKHLKQLTAAGLLESVPGPHGGYRLARSADAVTLLDVVLAIEGPKPAFRCAEIRQRGPGALEPKAYAKPCGINAAMLRAEQAYRAELRKTRLSDVISDYQASADPRSLAFGCAFVERHQRP
ncbi:RrF2 family transcriptional regulator [Nitratireductor kimnyeongensis]|uniref:RrF2 family transcriptional regulator n=1 Tax=Nitratireductor kimnyeongensis TaxID=430679 RepID=A0ABW0TA23_9HYPH|nr:Rrf2 family transcriptional regulator [Nitratireductor kimnyeongensis]QZZ35986.1 Rrf2 family transcriptional regulator [Nitratireductor kimnyeongensis]